MHPGGGGVQEEGELSGGDGDSSYTAVACRFSHMEVWGHYPVLILNSSDSHKAQSLSGTAGW